MALNDKGLPNTAQGVGVYPGMANPISSSNPTNPMETNFARRLFKETAGVIEGEPGIIESTNVHPLRPDSNDDDGWAHATTKSTQDAPGIAERAANAAGVAVGGAKMAYGHVAGNEEVKKQGEKAVYGTQEPK
ncbi:hypothetical protein C8F01DRAFT_1209565 [Mycena amicta]|nr:hypothetical protein C8F01DRAFT_1209565 [Mycena amicta]